MKMKRGQKVNIVIIILVLILAFSIIFWPNVGVEKELAKCIGENSELYIQLGCSACILQEEMFGKNYQYLNVIDCFYEREKCLEISGTPTWIINNQHYLGAREIEQLKELTGC